MTENVTPVEVEELGSDATALILTIMQQSAKDAAFTTDALIHGYKNDADNLRAELAAVRWSIKFLFEDGYQPSESRILAALWPSSKLIEDFKETDTFGNYDRNSS